jgi:hypothetical protein
MRPRRQRPEQQLQHTVFLHLATRGAPGLVAIHVPNGGARSPVEAAILKGLGVTAGVPDVLLWHGGASYAMELKAEVGRASEAQIEMLNKLAAAGVHTAVAYGLTGALTVLEGWGLLRGKLQ